MARTPSQKEIAAFIVGHGITDFVTGGRLSLIERNALWKVVKKLGPAAVRSVPRAAGTAVSVGRTIAMRHPYIAGGTLLYVAATNREQIADLIRQGYDVVQDVAETRQEFIQQNPEQFTNLPFVGPVRPIVGVRTPKRRRSTYNLSVGKGLKALKKSTSFGVKGKLTKKAFGFVAKTVSKLLKGKKVPSKGASGIVKRAIPGISKIKVRKS